MKYFTYVALAWALAVAALAGPAGAVVTTFATFSDPTSVNDFRFVNSGNANSRTTDATLYSTASGTSPTKGATLVKFSFLQPQLSNYVTNVDAKFLYSATIPRGTPALDVFGDLAQLGISGSFSFMSTHAITVTGPDFVTHTYAAGSDLLSGVFTDSALLGLGSTASIGASTMNSSVVTFASDFLDFSNTSERDIGLTLKGITPTLSIHNGANKALSSFRANVSGQFSSDPAPSINDLAVPEPGAWVLMVAGFGLVGASLRHRARAATA